MASAELLTSGFVKVRQDLNVVETFSVLVGKLQVDVMEHQQDVFITPGHKCGLLNIKRTTGNWKDSFSTDGIYLVQVQVIVQPGVIIR